VNLFDGMFVRHIFGLFDGFTLTNYFDLLICLTDWLVRQIGVPELL
jgi:hypothetical protein